MGLFTAISSHTFIIRVKGKSVIDHTANGERHEAWCFFI